MTMRPEMIRLQTAHARGSTSSAVTLRRHQIMLHRRIVESQRCSSTPAHVHLQPNHYRARRRRARRRRACRRRRARRQILSSLSTNRGHSFIITGITPDELKIAPVSPIFMADEENKFQNYRPISVPTCRESIRKINVKRTSVDLIEKDVFSHLRAEWLRYHDCMLRLDLTNWFHNLSLRRASSFYQYNTE